MAVALPESTFGHHLALTEGAAKVSSVRLVTEHHDVVVLGVDLDTKYAETSTSWFVADDDRSNRETTEVTFLIGERTINPSRADLAATPEGAVVGTNTTLAFTAPGRWLTLIGSGRYEHQIAFVRQD